MRLRQRIFGSYLLVSLALALVVGGLLYDTLADEVRAGIEERVATGVEMLAADLGHRSEPIRPEALDVYIDALATAANARLTVVAPDGTVLADSEFDGTGLAALDDHGSRTEIIEARLRGEGSSARYSRSADVELLYRARRIDRGPLAGGFARMAVPLTRIEAARAAAGMELLAGLAAATAVALVAGALLAHRLSRPIAELGRAADRVRRGDLTARARVDTGDELEDLARGLEAARDQLAARIAAASAERERLERVLEGMVEGVLVTDRAGRIALANRALQGIFGLDRPPQGRTVLEAVRHAEVAEALREAAVGEGPATREISLTWPRETALTLHAAGLPEGGAVGVFHDTTALRRVDVIRRDFVANVSHELRTPLANLAGYAEALLESADDPHEVRESAEVIRRNVARLSAIVGDLLELSQLEAEGFEPQRAEIRVAALLAELAAEWEPRAEAAGMRLATGSAADLIVRADPGLLRQAIGNLLENAVQHGTPGASIRLEARGSEAAAEFIVADTGPGIPQEDQPRLFERFYRVDRGRSRGSGGTGLGLSIVKHVAEVHGGTVTVESEPGAGARFHLTIPS